MITYIKIEVERQKRACLLERSLGLLAFGANIYRFLLMSSLGFSAEARVGQLLRHFHAVTRIRDKSDALAHAAGTRCTLVRCAKPKLVSYVYKYARRAKLREGKTSANTPSRGA